MRAIQFTAYAGHPCISIQNGTVASTLAYIDIFGTHYTIETFDPTTGRRSRIQLRKTWRAVQNVLNRHLKDQGLHLVSFVPADIPFDDHIEL